VLFANLILDGRLETPYARNLLATIESVRALRRRGAPQGQAALQRDRQLPRRQPAGARQSTPTSRAPPTPTWRAPAERHRPHSPTQHA
jgi:hypothetical protein